MKVMISYPPISSEKGTPMLSQNRQFQYFSAACYIYPVVPAYAATMLKEAGHKVVWSDAIAEQKTLQAWLEELEKEKPDLVAIETKTPVVREHWKIASEIKARLPKTKIAFMGDHVTALPQETLQNSQADFVLTGGDYDFLLLNLCNHLEKKQKLEPGIWLKEKGKINSTGKFELNHSLEELPLIDRRLTRWELYAEKNGNFRFLPGAYTMAGRDCWYGKCSFCSWTTLYPRFRAMKPKQLFAEVQNLVENFGAKEIMDDSGTFPTGKWLEEFCSLMIESGLNRKVRIDCNMRANALNKEQYELLRKAGFRLLLYGLESASQKTLDAIKKGTKAEDIEKACELAKSSGLEPHLTIMLGYPWETRNDAMNTIELAKRIFRKGHADTLQATVVIPYPGTPLFEECRKKGLLKTLDWQHYDMRETVMHAPISDAELLGLTQQLYKAFFELRYILRRLLSIRSTQDIKFIFYGLKRLFGHLKDFSPKQGA